MEDNEALRMLLGKGTADQAWRQIGVFTLQNLLKALLFQKPPSIDPSAYQFFHVFLAFSGPSSKQIQQ